METLRYNLLPRSSRAPWTELLFMSIVCQENSIWQLLCLRDVIRQTSMSKREAGAYMRVRAEMSV